MELELLETGTHFIAHGKWVAAKFRVAQPADEPNQRKKVF